MAEPRRLANHLGDIGAICNDAAFALMLAHCGVLREQVLRAAGAAFGHRLMRDRIVHGGVAADLDSNGKAGLRELHAELSRKFPLWWNSTTIPPRFKTERSALARWVTSLPANMAQAVLSGEQLAAASTPDVTLPTHRTTN